MVYFIVAAVASGVFLVAGWRSKQWHGDTALRFGHGLPHDPLWHDADVNLSDTPTYADAGAALRLALKRLGPVMASRSVKAEVAAAYGLRVRMRSGALADLLEEMLAAAIHAAPASRILLTATAQGDNVVISITDDQPNAALDVRRASVRTLMQRVSLRGGSLNIDVRPQEGTTMTLVLAADADTDLAHQGPAKVAAGATPEFSFGMSR